MRRTNLSLYYLFSYLAGGGLTLAAAPTTALRLMASTGSYGEVFPRLVGMLMIGLAIIVLAIIRLRVEAMYPVSVGLPCRSLGAPREGRQRRQFSVMLDSTAEGLSAILPVGRSSSLVHHT